MTEGEWKSCDHPAEMLRHLHGKIDDKDFMRFSVACCRRIWSLITDPRSQAVVEATEAHLNGALSTEATGKVCEAWVVQHQDEGILDLAGGQTNDAIESVYGLGDGHASQVSIACCESVGYAASKRAEIDGGTQTERTEAWKKAAYAERLAQCELVRGLFEYPK